MTAARVDYTNPPVGIFSFAQRGQCFERYACDRMFDRTTMALGWTPWREFKPFDYRRHPPGCPDGDFCWGNDWCRWRCTDDGEGP